jgi:hypothetical protein
MPVRAEDFLQFAEEVLRRPSPTEIDYRTAAARAYYAVMHLVRTELNLNPASTTHGAIRTAMLSMPPTSTPRHLHRAKIEWDTLWENRRRADYLIGEPFPRTEARASVAAARQIFDLRP